ncbi:hypothetical protein NDI56_13460 [Haloarcula sp. S1CR25-12]|uniref:DUF7979 domain-containing protein n=1 Tax=Haloarcula saliterrae TaxID=2950534 RepID=A0ABU2FF99_9EURY|nr:hypothetical protein [Haloarcula sp. S1CR25-12]MDS0260406.1 hypothetical protein [Haloarcula sp. S1CR25-12]
MVDLSRGQLSGLAMILVGTALIAASFVVVPYPGVAECEHEVSQVDETVIDDATPVTPFTALSPEAQAAFHAAVDTDGRHTAYGQSNRPPEWSYSDNVRYYVVRYQGGVYQVLTWADSFQFFDYGFVALGLVPGVALVGTGALRIRGRRLPVPRRPAVAGGAMALLAGGGIFLAFGLGIDSLVVTGGALLLCLGALVVHLGRSLLDGS